MPPYQQLPRAERRRIRANDWRLIKHYVGWPMLVLVIAEAIVHVIH